MKLYFRSYGSGHPLIVLHGLLGSGGNWHTLSSRWFGQHFAVYAVDQRNHGRSPHSPESDYEAMVSDLLEFMGDHGLASAHVLGHSMGGKTAMHLALSHPERVDRLVVADMAPRAYPPSHDVIFDALQSIDLSKYGSRQEIERTLAQKIPDVGTRQFLMKNLTHEAESGGYAWQLNLEAIYNGYDRLNEPVTSDKTFDKPALFIRGERSDYVRDSDIPGIKWLFPEAEFVTIPKAGHWVHADAPEAFASAVLQFLTAGQHA
ncbi:MAG TPA: alpha/beta fold hydrolase [Rhodothermales bacterium]|nr:alpha/beta fold hydrolase [Rhodothermales bacterium]